MESSDSSNMKEIWAGGQGSHSAEIKGKGLSSPIHSGLALQGIFIFKILPFIVEHYFASS